MLPALLPGAPKRRLARFLAVAAGCAALLTQGASVASAADGHLVWGEAIATFNGSRPGVPAVNGQVTHKSIDLGAALVPVYCIQLTMHADDTIRYTEASGPVTDIPNTDRVTWILDASFPTRSAAQVADRFAVPGLTDSEAEAATQLAIWHFTDGFDLASVSGTDVDAARAKLLYTALVMQAAAFTQPGPPSLSLVPKEIDGSEGTRVGPITATTSTTAWFRLDGAPAGFGVLDASGNLITGFAVGQSPIGVFVDCPVGSAGKTLKLWTITRDRVPVGRIWVGEDGPTQMLMSPAATETTVSDSTTIRCTAGAQPSRTSLVLTKKANRTARMAGRLIWFTISVRNTGTLTANGVRVCDRIPDTLNVVSAVGSAFEAGNVCWVFASLTPGQTRTVRLGTRSYRDSKTVIVMNRAYAIATNAARATAHARVKIVKNKAPRRRLPGVTG